MFKLIVFFYLVFEVSSKSNDKRLFIKASTKGMAKLSPQAFKGTAQLIYLLNKQISDEKEHLDYNDKDTNAKVDLDYYNTAYGERKESVIELMKLIQKNYDAKKFDKRGIDDVRIHMISNPEVLERYKKKLFRHKKSSNIDISEDINYPKTKRSSKRRNSAFRFDSLSKETNANLNQDDEKSIKERDKNFEDSLKEHFNEKLVKIISEDSLNQKVNKDKSKNKSGGKKQDNNSNLKKGKVFHRLGNSLEEFKKDDPIDWQKEDENNSSGESKEKLITKGLWQIYNSREEPKKEWKDDKRKKTTKNDDYQYDLKDKKEIDKDDWGKTRKSKPNQRNHKETTKKDIIRNWEDKEKIKRVKNKDDDWSQVGKPKKWEDENKTTKKHLDFDRPDKKIKHKWSAEVAVNIKTTKNSNSRSAKIKIMKSGDNSWEKEKKRTNKNDWDKKDDSWDTWPQKKSNNWDVKKTTERKEKFNDWSFKKESYNDKPKKAKNKDIGRFNFARTPIPFVGKKGIYED